ncbi:MAG: hypothetical protein JXP34_27130 [Planctomycetes bacterium]|nr:hypothetical protein [Planctomycetota bacterium]
MTSMIERPGGNGAPAAILSAFMLAASGLGAPAPAPALGPMPIARLIERGEARILSHSPFDIGKDGREAVDGDPDTLARTPAVNPAEIVIAFSRPIEVVEFRILLSRDAYRFRIEASDEEDGPFVPIVEERETGIEGEATARPAPGARRVFRLWVRRLTGDDYVHIREWSFRVPVAWTALRLERLIRRQTAISPPAWAPVEDGRLEAVPEDTIVALRGRVADAEGLDIVLPPGEIVWACDGVALEAYGDAPGAFVTRIPGPGWIAARGAGLETRLDVTVAARPPRGAGPRDLEVLFVERVPRIPFDAPGGGWPATGAPITWRAHVRVWGGPPYPLVEYRWSAGDRPIAAGATAPDGGGACAIDLPAVWTATPQLLRFEIDPGDAIPEAAEWNNAVEFRTDALAVGFWVERGVWDLHRERQLALGLGDAASFAGWAQRHMRQWNRMFRAASFPEVPEGIVDRVRLDRLVIIPDLALPLGGGLPTNNPDNRDRTVDLVWGFPSVSLETDWWDLERAKGKIARDELEGAALYLDLALIHELGHARYLIDSYGFDVHATAGPDRSPRIDVTDPMGRPVRGFHLGAEGIVHLRDQQGQMGGDYARYGLYEALMLNRIAGRRARGGNYNSPDVIGEFLQEIPARFRLILADEEGHPLGGAEIRIHRARPSPGDWYGKRFVDPPDLVLRADPDGGIDLDRTVFSADGVIRHGYGHTNGIILAGASLDGRAGYIFLEVTWLNIAYALGQRERAEIRRTVPMK